MSAREQTRASAPDRQPRFRHARAVGLAGLLVVFAGTAVLYLSIWVRDLWLGRAGGDFAGGVAGVGIFRTTSGGATWTSADASAYGVQASCCDPGVAYGSDGTVYAIILDTSPAAAYGFFGSATDPGIGSGTRVREEGERSGAGSRSTTSRVTPGSPRPRCLAL